MKELIHQNPAVSLYKAVLLKKLKSDGNADFNEVLKSTSLHVPDRKHLYHFIHSKEKVNSLNLVEAETVASNFVEDIMLEAETTTIEVEKIIEKPKKKKTAVKEAKPKKVKKEQKQVVKEEVIAEVPKIQPKKDKIPVEDVLTTEVEVPIAETNKEEHTFEDWLNFLDSHQIEEKEAMLNNQIDRHLVAATYEVELKEEIEALEQEEEGEHVLTEDAAQKVTTLAQDSITFTSGAITETLAKIMLMQGKINESIAMYEQLVLKYPEKSNYFAAQIELIKKK